MTPGRIQQRQRHTGGFARTWRRLQQRCSVGFQGFFELGEDVFYWQHGVLFRLFGLGLVCWVGSGLLG